MELPPTSIELLWVRTQAYTKATFELFKLKALETTIQLTALLIAKSIVFLMLMLFLLVLSLGLAFWLGDLLGKIYYGFFVVAGFYLVAAVVLHFFLFRWIKKPLGDLVAAQALD